MTAALARADVHFTKHATGRILDMALEPYEVRDALNAPVRQFESRKYPGTMLYSRDRITLVVDEQSMSVITVLWATADGWQQDLERAPYAGDDCRNNR